MVKIPYTVRSEVGIARENPAFQQIDMRGLNDAFGANIGNAVNNFGEGLGNLAVKIEARQQQAGDFEAERLFQQLNGNLDKQWLELQRSSPVDGSGLPQNMAQTYAGYEQDFRSKLRPDQQQKFAPRLEALKERYAYNSILKQFELQDKHSQTTLNSTFQEHVKGISVDPNTTTERERAFAELIRSSTLPQVVKDNMARIAVEGFRLARARQDAKVSPEIVAGATGGLEAALRQRESSDNPKAVNQLGYAGSYQFGAPRLATLGLYVAGEGENLSTWSKSGRNAPGKWSGQFNIPGFPEVKTLNDFLENPAAQRKAYEVHDARMDQEILRNGFDKFIGQEVRGVQITREGLKAGMHLGGPSGVAKFFAGGDSADANGTKVATYMRMGAGVAAAPERYAGVSLEKLQSAMQDGLREKARDEAAATAMREAQNSQSVASLELAIYNGKAGMTEALAFREQGIIDDAGLLRLQKQIENVENKTAVTREAQGNIQNDQFQWNPLLKEHKAQVNALSEQLDGKVSPTERLQFDMKNWERTQIASDYLTASVAGGLISTDPKRVQSAATIAANMLARNENAFAGAQNAAAIEKAAWEYQRLTQTLGLTAEEATRRIAGMNDPQTKAQMAPKGTDAAKFREEIAKKDFTSEILGVFNPSFWGQVKALGKEAVARTLGPGYTQIQATQEFYKEFMIEHYNEFGDKKAAEKYAKNKLSQQFGISRDRLMQFPPEKAEGIPKINGSKDWVYKQAADEVTAIVGKMVKPEDIVLIPSDGGRGGMSTRDAFVLGKPVPYIIQYNTMSEAGFPIREQLFVPGSRDGRVWVPDARKFQESMMPEALARGVRAGTEAEQRRNDLRSWTGNEAGAPPIGGN